MISQKLIQRYKNDPKFYAVIEYIETTALSDFSIQDWRDAIEVAEFNIRNVLPSTYSAVPPGLIRCLPR